MGFFMPLDLYSMVGYLVVHNEFGPGKIVGSEGRNIQVYIAANERQMTFGKAAIDQGSFSRSPLYPGALVKSKQGICKVTRFLNPQSESAFEYNVVYEDSGLTARITELEIFPLSAEKTDTLVGKLLEGRPSDFKQFASRENLLISTTRLKNKVGSLQALLSSRIEVYPHQAFVSGLVINDPVKRYILADEVGLGKTIEAGIILQDRLSAHSSAKVLVLTPSPLTRQWLSELHSSFGSGKDFKLADLRPEAIDELHTWNKVICSNELAVETLSSRILACQWDMIIVDEVHHLLEQPLLYDFVKKLSHIGTDLLLLSAIPVRKREGELYKLLALLEPNNFCESKLSEQRFLELYEAQHAIGRRIRLLRRDIADYRNSEASKGDLINRIDRLTSFEMMSNDESLNEMKQRASGSEDCILDTCAELLQHVADNYRLNRRVLRNRRGRLIEEENLEHINREVALHQIHASDFEQQANHALLEFLIEVKSAIPVTKTPIFLSFARILFQSSVDNELCLQLLEALFETNAEELTDLEIEIVTSVASFNSENALRYLRLLLSAVRFYVSEEHISKVISSINVWNQYEPDNARWATLVNLLDIEQQKQRKTIIFAGFPGLAEKLYEIIVAKFGSEKVSKFLFSQDDFEKEENVRDFRDLETRQFMICDESGGEGRNFQFANSIVHADLPYIPNLIEQRVGRLDRLGRQKSMGAVTSHVIIGSGCVDERFFAFLNDGLSSFTSSISGLEFALRNLQDEFIGTILDQSVEPPNFINNVVEIVADERVRDESDELLDEASFNPKFASIYVTAGRYNDDQLPSIFVEHFKNLSTKPDRSVSKSGSEVWKFKPDDVPLGTLDISSTSENSEFGIRTGTFDRKTAQSRRDLEFFSYGNPFFDAVIKSLHDKNIGRTYAISCRSNSAVSFAGIEYNLVPRIQLPPELPQYYASRIETGLPYRPDWNYCSLNPDFVFEAKEVHQIRKNVTKGLVGFENLSLRKIKLLESQQQASLEDRIKYIQEIRMPSKETKFQTRIDDFISSENEELSAKNKKLKNIADFSSAKEIEQNELYLEAIKNWFLDIDTIGFLVINK